MKMSEDMQLSGVLALIPARGGSKGLPGKNLKDFFGKPLLAWTIEAAASLPDIDHVVLSSDDEQIMSVGLAYGCKVPFKRDASLAEDSSSMIDVVLDVLDRNPDVNTVVLLQPTSPLRGDIDISSALAIYRMSGAKTCVSVCEAIQSPYWMFTVSDQLVLEPLSIAGSRILRRQELPVAYSLNGAIYIADAKWLKESRCFVDSNTVAYVMPKSRSIDIDTQEDLELAEFFYRKNKSATS